MKIIAFTAISMMTVFFTFAAKAETLPDKEAAYYELQANLIANFIKHLDWEKPFDPKVVCVIGDNPVMPYLNSLTKNNSHIVAKRKYEDDFIDDCSLLFVNKYFKGHFKKLLLKAENKPILTISDIENFAKYGGIVQFSMRQKRVEMVVNKKSLRRSRIQISNAILASAELVDQ